MGGKNEGEKLGLDVIDEPLKAAARGLLASVKQAKRVDAFAAWQEHAFLETSISLLEREVKPYEAILNSLPQDRSKEDVRKISGLLRQISAYKAFAPHILEFIGTHCQLMVVWEGVELPRTGDEASNLYNVLCGHMQCVVADPRDPLIHYAVHDSAQQILKGEAEAAAAEAKANPRGPKSPPPTRSLFTMESPCQESLKADSPAGVSPHESSPYISNSDTVHAYNLPQKCQTAGVACKLWRGVLNRIQAGKFPPRAEAEQLLASVRVGEDRIRERRRFKRRSSQGGRIERQESVRQRSSGGGDSNRQEGGGPVPSDKEEHDGAARQPQGPGPMGGPNNPWPKISLLQLGKGESFSGRELDCFHEVGLMEGGAALEPVPARAVAALPVPNSMAALLYVSRAVYRRALDMVQEHTIGHTVSRCCRLPFLRHTPLKELYKLARYLHEVRLSKGDTLIEQGKENSTLYLLIEGEVEVIVDVPYSDDRELLESALLSKMLMQDNSGAEGRNSAAASLWSSRNASRAAAYSGPLQRVVMARRGPGSVLGDDSLRERKTAVGVVVSSSSLLALAVPQQRFAMSVDALTLRLFMRLKQQQGALPLMSQAVSAALLSKQKVDHCRKVILSQALSPNARRRGEGEASDTSEAELMQLLLSSSGSKAGHKQKPSMGWNRTGSHVYKPPLLSLASGDRADKLTALHKKKCEMFELEVRQEALAEREGLAKSAAASAPGNTGGKGEHQLHTEASHADVNAFSPATTAALKALNKSKRTMQVNMLGADSGGGLSDGSGRVPGGPMLQGTEGGGGGNAEQGLGDLMTQSMQTAWMDKIQVTESVAQLRQMIKQAAEKRRAEVMDQEHRNLQGRSNLVNVDARIVHKLDISVQEASGSTLKHTTMLESACIAVIKVHLLPGQAVAPCDDLAPVLDDAVVGWSAAAHSAHLQLVRWSSFEYALVARIDPSESKRAAVKATADCLLEMKKHFDHTIATNAVPHYTCRTGLACGGAFAQHNGGHFLTGISGTAVKAAQLLADAAVAVQGPHSCIFISDVAMQAICRTHLLRFVGTAYELLDWVKLPCNSSFNDIFGPGSFEAEPVAQGMIPSEFQAGTEEEEQHQFPSSPGWAWSSIRQPSPKAHTQPTALAIPKPGAHEQQPASPTWLSGRGSLCWPESQVPARSSAPTCLWVDIPDKTPDPGSGLPRVASPSYPTLPSPAFPSPQGSNKSLGRPSSCRSKPRRGPASLTTLEPEPRHSRVAGMRTRAELASSMGVRQRLRQDLQASRSQQAQQSRGLSVSPSTGKFFGGLQGGLKTWGHNGRARKAPSPTLQEASQPRYESKLPNQEQQEQQQQQRKQGWPWSSFTSSQPVLLPHGDEHTENEEIAHWQEACHGSTLPADARMPSPTPKQQQQQQQQQQHTQASHSLHHHQLLQQQQARPRTSSPRSPLSTKPDVFPHYAPGSKSPLASLSARHRASEVLFTGAALASSAHQLIRPVSPSRSSAPPLALSPTDSPRNSSPPLQTLGDTTLAHDSLDAVLQTVVKQKRASPERLLPQRPDSALQALHRPLSAQQQAFAAAVALDGRPMSAGSSIGEHGPLRLASPSLRLRQAMPSSAPATPPGRTEPPSSSTDKLLPSNHGYVPASMLQYPRCARPPPGGGGLCEQDMQGTRSWYPPPDTPIHLSSAPLQQGSMAASPSGSPRRDEGPFGEPDSPLGLPHAPVQPLSAHSASRFSSANAVARGSSRGSSVRPRSRMHTPSFMHSRQVDPYTGMSLSTIHEQAISTWKDLGSLNAAQEYVEQLPQGQVNVSFSAAGLATLPDLSRLMFLESLVASFNSFHLSPDPQAILGRSPLTHLSVLCMSYCGLTELPCNIGRLLPALTELNLAHNSITELPLSLFQCHKLRAISLEHNQLCSLPEDGLSRLTGLESLYLGSNSLQNLPGCLPCLQMLVVLDVKRNQIEELPANLTACTQLVVLSVAYNRLTALPPSSLDALTNLRWLELQGNSLRSCPEVNGAQVATAVKALDTANTLAAKAQTAAAEARAVSLPGFASLREQASEEGVQGLGRIGRQQGQLLQRRRAKDRVLAPTGDTGLEGSCGAALQQEADSEQPYVSQQGSESEQSDEAAAVAEAPLGHVATSGDVKAVHKQQQQQQQQQERQLEQEKQQQQQQQQQQERQLEQEKQKQQQELQALQVPSSPPKMQRTTSFSANLHAEAHNGASGPSQSQRIGCFASSSRKATAGEEHEACKAPASSLLENEITQEVLAKSTPCRLPNLHWLNLANNRLALPPLWLPSSLTGLDLSCNRLSLVPSWLVDSLPQLQMLALHGNCITEVCEEIKNLSSLKMVSLEENPATDPGNMTEGGSWVSELVCTAKFDHKLHLEAELQKVKHGERRPSHSSS